MRTDEQVRFVIDIDVVDADEFVALATEMVQISNAEPGTLVYDWYLDRETNKAKLYEAYDSIDSLIAHIKGPVFSDVAPRMKPVANFVHIDAYGNFPDVMKRGKLMAPTTWWGPAFVAVSHAD